MQNDALLTDLAQCGSPETLLAAILKHHPGWCAPVAVETFARSVGIVEIRDLKAEGFASAVIADFDRKKGVILCAPGLSAQRRRFAIAHQLGHFLLQGHPGDRQCTSRDLSENRRDTAHRKEEMQANRFAAGLLVPKPWLVGFVDGLGKPTVAHLPMIAAAYEVSLEVAASRYVDLTQALYAFILVKNGVVRFVIPSRTFPPLAIRPLDRAPAAVLAARPGDRIAWVPTDFRDWLVQSRDVRPPRMTMQILSKESGLQIVMLFINAASERRADEEAEKDATERPKFGRPRSR